MSIIKLSPYILDSTLDFTFNNVTATGNIVSLNANLGNAAVANYFTGTLTTVAQPNITSIGTLSSLTVTGNGSFGNVNAGNLITANYTTAVITTAAQPNITSVGTLSSLTVTGNGSFGNVNAGNLLTANYSTAVLTIGAQPNITSVGTLTGLVIGNATANSTFGNGTIVLTSAGNLTGGNLVSATYLTGTLTTAAQPNITSVGTLGNLTVTSNVGAGNVKTDNLLYANGVAWAFGSGTPGGSNTFIQFNDGSTFGGNANLTFDKTTTTLTANNFVATTTANLGVAGNVKITGGSSGQYLKTDGAGNLSWSSVTATGGGASVTVSSTAPATPAQGDLWLDAESGDLNVYFGGAWGDVSPGASQLDIQVNNFTGDGVTSTFTLTVTPGGTNYTIVTIGGVVQPRNYYTITNAVINFGVAPASGVSIEVSIFGGGASPIGLAGSVTNGAQPNITSVGTLANLSATGNTTITGNLTLNGSGVATTGKSIAMAIVFGF
jgi:hypothetical protein